MTRANKIRTAVRKCATCGEPFTWTSRNPKRRFCDPICKARWWRASNNADTATTAPTPTGVTATEPAAPPTSTTSPSTGRTTNTTDLGTASTANAVTQPYDPYISGYRNGQAPTAVQSCPNCREPVAVINLLVAPAAAYVNTPSRSVTDHQQHQ